MNQIQQQIKRDRNRTMNQPQQINPDHNRILNQTQTHNHHKDDHQNDDRDHLLIEDQDHQIDEQHHDLNFQNHNLNFLQEAHCHHPVILVDDHDRYHAHDHALDLGHDLNRHVRGQDHLDDPALVHDLDHGPDLLGGAHVLLLENFTEIQIQDVVEVQLAQIYHNHNQHHNKGFSLNLCLVH